MMTKLIIIGAGGHSAEIHEYIKHAVKLQGHTQYEITGFIDDNESNYHSYKFDAPYLGTIKDHEVVPGTLYIIGIANLDYRRKIITALTEKGAEFTSFIHPLAYVSASAEIGVGVVIAPYVNIGPNVVVGNFNLINSRASIGHDSKMGDYNFISPNVCFSGFTIVGNENLFGINSATIPQIKIGNNNKIAAGMIVDRDVDDDTVVFHRFKEKVMAIPKQIG